MVWQQQAAGGSAFATLDEPPKKDTSWKRPRKKPMRMLESALDAHQAGHLERALRAYEQIMGLDPENVYAMTAAAVIHADKGELDAAEWLLRRSIAVAPTCIAYNTLGAVIGARRQWDGAVNAYRASIQLDPTNTSTWPNLLFALDLHPSATPALRLAERRRFNEIYCKPLTQAAAPHTNDPDPDRRLRVGYVSGDFKQHSAAHGFGPVVLGHHKDVVETYLYDVDQAIPDPQDLLKPWFRDLSSVWRDARQLSDESLAALIREDEIDILVDLSGYSGGGRVLAFARKPAPIQIGGFGYGTGTGIDAMDYVIGDDVVIPEAHEKWYHERILRLPSFMGYEKAPPWPELGPPAKIANGYPTFGYLGRAIKVSPQALAAWGEILMRVPDARMIFKSSDLGDPNVVAGIKGALTALGVEADRLEFRGGTSRFDHLAVYNEIDVALDPFPHGGGVTAVEAFLGGVPMVTLLGNYLCGRAGASIMTTLGFKHAVARTPFEYVNHAVEMAGEPWTIEDRFALRTRLVGSILLDEERYASAIEDAYRAVWQAWCSGRIAVTPGD